MPINHYYVILYYTVVNILSLAYDLLQSCPPVRCLDRLNVQTSCPDRKKVFEDIQRLLYPEDILNREVFDLEDPR